MPSKPRKATHAAMQAKRCAQNKCKAHNTKHARSRTSRYDDNASRLALFVRAIAWRDHRTATLPLGLRIPAQLARTGVGGRAADQHGSHSGKSRGGGVVKQRPPSSPAAQDHPKPDQGRQGEAAGAPVGTFIVTCTRCLIQHTRQTK